MMNETMYQAELLDHYKYPKNNKPLEKPDFSSDQTNSSCGDSMHVEGIIGDNKLMKVSFRGKGCVISQATASMLTQECLGKTIDDILTLSADDVSALIGVQLGPVRIKCALLSLQALKQGILPFTQKLTP